MDEYVMKQKIQETFFEPRAPEGLIQQVILRSKAVVMGVAAQKHLETAPAENIAGLAARVLIGQLAIATQLPEGAQPEQLARQLEQQPAFIAALQGGNVAHRLNSGALLQQITGQKPPVTQLDFQNAAPRNEGPIIGSV